MNLRPLLIGALVIVVIGGRRHALRLGPGRVAQEVWRTITTISLGDLIAGVALITIQTTTAAFAWYSILRYAYPGQVRWVPVWACYAAAVALNFVLPANIGTLVMMLMFTTIIVAATFTGVLAGYVVQKVFFTAIGVATYLYLFLSVGGSFRLQFGFIEEHPWAFVILLGAAIVLIYLVAQTLRPRILGWWEDAKEGGQILARPNRYLLLVAAPEAISWLAMLGTIAVFLSAYNIPVTFHTLISVVGGNSIANMTSVTPGGAGVVQSFNVLSLQSVTSASNATAYSVAQQLVETAWSIALAIILLVRAFGWTGGRQLVGSPTPRPGRRLPKSRRSGAHDARRDAAPVGRAMSEASAPRTQRHRQRYTLLLLAIIVVFVIEGVAQPSSFEQVLVTALLGATLLLALSVAEVRPPVMRVAAVAVLAVIAASDGGSGGGQRRRRHHPSAQRGARRGRPDRRRRGRSYGTCAPARR